MTGRATGALQRARDGDAAAFSELIAPYLGELRLHCYRMLGSLSDAEDALQETLLAAWRGLPEFAGRSSPRTWLYQIATRRCLNAIRDRRRRPAVAPTPPFPPPAPSRRDELPWLQPYPDAWLDAASASPTERYERHAAVELAFIAALQRLAPRQAAALILVDVVGFSAAEAGGLLGCGAVATKGLLQRARAARSEETAPRHAPAGGPASAAERRLASRFADAFVAGDVAGVVALLTDDAVLAMPPAAHVYLGPEAIAAFLGRSFAWRARRIIALADCRANGQPAFSCTLRESSAAPAGPIGLIVLTMRGERIAAITRFLDDALNARWTPSGESGAIAGSAADGSVLGAPPAAGSAAQGQSASAL